MILQAAIERATSRRQDLLDLSGDQMLDVLMARVAHDASQTLAADRSGYGPAANGAREDRESARTLKWLLGLMSAARTSPIDSDDPKKVALLDAATETR